MYYPEPFVSFASQIETSACDGLLKNRHRPQINTGEHSWKEFVIARTNEVRMWQSDSERSELNRICITEIFKFDCKNSHANMMKNPSISVKKRRKLFAGNNLNLQTETRGNLKNLSFAYWNPVCFGAIIIGAVQFFHGD